MISFFAKHSFLANQRLPNSNDLTIVRLSSEIRAKQIAEYIGGKYNPKGGYENDVCIYIKPGNLDRVRDVDYVDFSDGLYTGLIEKLKQRPKIRILAHSTYLYKYLKERLPNEIIYLPQQHLNWERVKRERKGMTTGGYIGSSSSISIKMNTALKEALAKMGMDYVMCYNWRSREDAINFYKQIDFLVIYGYGNSDEYNPCAQPTKMINAASFGIPSLANWQVGYEEFEGYYMRFKTMDDLAGEVQKLKDENYYNKYAKRIINKAEEYHIDNIAKQYERLNNNLHNLQ